MKHPFEPISLPRKNPAAMQGKYRVYSAAGNFKLVTAENAAEALKASGLPDAWRIERYVTNLCPVLDSEIFSEVAAVPPTPPPAAAATPAETAPPETPAQKPLETAAPLSSDDVNKLLQENPPPPSASA